MTRHNLRKGTLAIVIAAVMAAMSACGNISGTVSDNSGAMTVPADSTTADTAAGENATNGETAAQDGTDSTSAAGSGTAGETSSAGTSSAGNTYTAVTAEMINFKSGDMYERWTYGTVTGIEADGDTVSISRGSSGITAEGTDISITTAGTYVFEGKLNGTITVNAGEKEKVRLILNGFEITSSDGPAIRIMESDRVTISLESDTENTVTDSEIYSDETFSAAIYSKADLVLNGSGTLKVNAKHNDGIASKDDLRIISGTYAINAADDGIVGKDRVEIKDGTFQITSGGDAIKSTNIENVSKGFVYIANGSFTLTSGDEAVDAASSVRIDGGDFNIKTADGAENAAHMSSDQGFGAQGRPGGKEYGRDYGRGGFSGELPDTSGETPEGFSDGTPGADGQMPEDFTGHITDASGNSENGFGWDRGRKGPDRRDSESLGSLSGTDGSESSGGNKTNTGTLTQNDEMASGGLMMTAAKGSSKTDTAKETTKGAGQTEAADGTPEEAGQTEAADGTPEEAGQTEAADGTPEETGQTEAADGTLEEAAIASARADENDDTDTADTTAAAKGIKCEGVLEIRGGTFVMDTQDDAIHSNYRILISGGTLTIKAGDDGIHADDTLDIKGGKITVEDSYEGLEAVNINISGGDTSVTASDDGVNAAGGDLSYASEGADNAGSAGMPGTSGSANAGASEGASGSANAGASEGASGSANAGAPEGASGSTNPGTPEGASGSTNPGAAEGASGSANAGTPEGASGAANPELPRGPQGRANGGMPGGMFEESSGFLTITGGKLYVNADGDGLDANTDITQTGGEVIVEGPTNNGNGSLDYGNSYIMSGGTLIATGSPGMLQTISEDSEAYAITVLFSDNVAAGTTLSLKNSFGKEIASIKTTKVTQTLQFAGDGLKNGGTYTLFSDDEELCKITLTGTVTTVDDSGAETSVSGMDMGGGHMRR